MTSEDHLQFALVDFRTMQPKMQRDFIVGVLDEFMGLAKEGKIDRSLAAQVLCRAELVASFVGLPQPGQLRMVSNNG